MYGDVEESRWTTAQGYLVRYGESVKDALISHPCFPIGQLFSMMGLLRAQRRAEWFVRLRRMNRRWTIIARYAPHARVA